MSLASSVGNVATLVKYWSKGRFTRTTFLVVVLGEIALSIFLLFAGGTFLSFSARFGQSGGRPDNRSFVGASSGVLSDRARAERVLRFRVAVCLGGCGLRVHLAGQNDGGIYREDLAQFRQRVAYLSADLFPVLASHAVLRHTRYYSSGRGNRDLGVFLYGVIVQRGYYARTEIGFRAKDVCTKVSIDRLDSRGQPFTSYHAHPRDAVFHSIDRDHPRSPERNRRQHYRWPGERPWRKLRFRPQDLVCVARWIFCDRNPHVPEAVL